jgi:hypothetical protein
MTHGAKASAVPTCAEFPLLPDGYAFALNPFKRVAGVCWMATNIARLNAISARSCIQNFAR